MDSRTPILVGSAQYVDRNSASIESLSPTDISHLVAEEAIRDASKSPGFGSPSIFLFLLVCLSTQ